jgi:hypothetical protein
LLGQRLKSRKVKDIYFDTYKELYPRLDGGNRQVVLCGRENGLGRKNIFEYYYYGQQEYKEHIFGFTIFTSNIIDVPKIERKNNKSVFIAPHEKCQGNRFFTLDFWKKIVTELLKLNIEVTINDKGNFCNDIKSNLLRYSFVPFNELPLVIAREQLVLCGNTGLGWMASAVDTSLIAFEKDMIFAEYAFHKCGLTSLLHTISEPEVQKTVNIIKNTVDNLNCQENNSIQVIQSQKHVDKINNKRTWRLIWMPEWMCQNYTMGKSFGENCPYCPYSYDTKSERLIYEGVSVSSNKKCEYKDILKFLLKNATLFNKRLEISGGEPLLYNYLPEILAGLNGWVYGITSNTLYTKGIENIIEKCGRMDGCVSWTASYHPFSKKDDIFANNISLIKKNSKGRINATLVISEHTIDDLKKYVGFLKGLPIGNINFHLDTHKDHKDLTNPLLERVNKEFPDIKCYAGLTYSDSICEKYNKLLCLTPDGTLYPCVSKAYNNNDPIGNINLIDLNILPDGEYTCKESCFACCDFIKRKG